MAGGGIGGPLQAAGTILGAFDKYQTAGAEANQLEQNATQAFAGAQRTFLQTQRQLALVQSKVRSVAGASGAGAQDVGVQNIQSEIGRQGEYDALTALFNGRSEQQALRLQAAADRAAGQDALVQGAVGAAGDIAGMPDRTVGGGGSTLFSRYAGKLPSWMGGTDPNADLYAMYANG